MTDKLSLTQQADRGQRAKRIVEDDLVKEALQRMEKAAIKVWRETKPEEAELRELAYFRIQAIEDFRACFNASINDGKLAEDRLLKLAAEQETTHPQPE